MGHNWENESHLENITHLKMVQTMKDVSHVEKGITRSKMGHTYKKGSHLGKWESLGK